MFRLNAGDIKEKLLQCLVSPLYLAAPVIPKKSIEILIVFSINVVTVLADAYIAVDAGI